MKLNHTAMYGKTSERHLFPFYLLVADLALSVSKPIRRCASITLKMSKLIAAIDQRGTDYRTGAVSLSLVRETEVITTEENLTSPLTCNHGIVLINDTFSFGF